MDLAKERLVYCCLQLQSRSLKLPPLRSVCQELGEGYQVFFCYPEGHSFWKTNLKSLIDSLQKVYLFLREREKRKAHSQSTLTGSSKCLAGLNLGYSFGFISPVNLIIQSPAGNVKDAATGAKVNMVR